MLLSGACEDTLAANEIKMRLCRWSPKRPANGKDPCPGVRANYGVLEVRAGGALDSGPGNLLKSGEPRSERVSD